MFYTLPPRSPNCTQVQASRPLQKRRSNEDFAEARDDVKDASEHGDDLEDIAEDRVAGKDASEHGDDLEEATETRNDYEHAVKTKKVQNDRNKDPYRITKMGPESAVASNMLGSSKRTK